MPRVHDTVWPQLTEAAMQAGGDHRALLLQAAHEIRSLHWRIVRARYQGHKAGREREIVRLRRRGLTQREIGRRFGISDVRVGMILRRAEKEREAFAWAEGKGP